MRDQLTVRALSLFLALLLVGAACSSGSTEDDRTSSSGVTVSSEPPSYWDSAYIVSEIVPAPPDFTLQDVRLEIRLEGGRTTTPRLVASAGCNELLISMESYTTVVGTMEQELLLCEDPMGAAERFLGAFLDDEPAIEAGADGSLELVSDKFSLRLARDQ